MVGRKTGKRSDRATFVVLHERPTSSMAGAEIARQVHRLIHEGCIPRLEDGPVDAGQVTIGDDNVAQALDAPLTTANGWPISRVADLSLAQCAYQVAEGRLWLPTMKRSTVPEVKMTMVKTICEVGPYHADVGSENPTGPIRGPLKISRVKPGSVPTYPVLWAHDAGRETTMVFDADCEGTPRKCNAREKDILEEKVEKIWATASHCHFNRDFMFNSQPTGIQFTPNKTIGGRAWISLSMKSVDHAKALVLWGNTTLGLLMHWWHANKNQTGRGSIGVEALGDLRVLNVTKLTGEQLTSAVKIFDDLCKQELLPLNEIDRDSVRKKLDTAFIRDVLGLDSSIADNGGPIDLLRRKLAHEPSIHRGKKLKARGAGTRS